MDISVADIVRRARALPPEDRAELVEALLESLQGPPIADIEAEWAREIEYRVAAWERGEMPAVAAEEVFAEARRPRR